MTIKKIGFACKISELNQKNEIVAIPEYNSKTTTVLWLNRQPRQIAEEKLWELLNHNLSAAINAVQYISDLDENLRLFRLGSDILPVYTHHEWSWFWQQSDVKQLCEREFAKVGDLARKNNVRLSFHPGQFTVLASDNPLIVSRSIEEFEYHADMIRWMGYGKTFQDFKCNVHIAGRLGAQGIIDVYGRLSPEARNCITIENEEMKHGLDDCLVLTNHGIPIVLDIHHHYIREGEYISTTDSRFKRVVDSWRGLRPTMHYSVSREDYLVNHPNNVLPDHAQLLAEGYKKSKMRAHSDFYWNDACNDWALTFLEHADIMCEVKSKNLGSFSLYHRAKELGLV